MLQTRDELGHDFRSGLRPSARARRSVRPTAIALRSHRSFQPSGARGNTEGSGRPKRSALSLRPLAVDYPVAAGPRPPTSRPSSCGSRDGERPAIPRHRGRGTTLHRSRSRLSGAADTPRGLGISSANRNRVPSQAACAPRANTAATPRASPIPPAAMTGIGATASTTAGTNGSVATPPHTCPPASQPCATMMSTPHPTARRASSALPTVCRTSPPASCTGST